MEYDAPQSCGTGSEDHDAFASMFASLTEKQHEVLRLIVEHRTSKEIAAQLAITESAVNQRLESVRARIGFPPRAKLARAYFRYLGLDRASALRRGERAEADHPVEIAEDGLESSSSAVETSRVEQCFGPVLRDHDVALTRVAAMVVIAAGLLLIALVGLGVAHSLSILWEPEARTAE